MRTLKKILGKRCTGNFDEIINNKNTRESRYPATLPKMNSFMSTMSKICYFGLISNTTFLHNTFDFF